MLHCTRFGDAGRGCQEPGCNSAMLSCQLKWDAKEERLMTMSGFEQDRGELGRVLQEAGSTYDAQSVEVLIEGVLAAPAEIGTSWHMLVADPVTPALAAM